MHASLNSLLFLLLFVLLKKKKLIPQEEVKLQTQNSENKYEVLFFLADNWAHVSSWQKAAIMC